MTFLWTQGSWGSPTILPTGLFSYLQLCPAVCRDDPLLAACAKVEAPKEEGLPAVVQGLQEKRCVSLPSRCPPSRRSPDPSTPLSPTTPRYYLLCSTHLRVPRVTTPSNPFCCEHEIHLRAGASSEGRHPFLPGLDLGMFLWRCGRADSCNKSIMFT